MLVDTVKGTCQPAFDHVKLANKLADATKQSVAPDRLPLRHLTLAPDSSDVFFRFSNRNWHWSSDGGSLTAHDQPLDSGELIPLQRIEPSTNGGESTSILFVNQLDQPVRLHWIPPDGTPRQYATLDAGKTHDQHTYQHHVWLLTDRDGTELAVLRATAAAATFVLSTDTPRPSRSVRPREGGRVECHNPTARQTAPANARVRFDSCNVILERKDGDNGTWESLRLSDDGTAADAFGGQVDWSDNGEYFMVWRTRFAKPRQVKLVQSSPPDKVQPELIVFPYNKPGDPLDHPRPYLGSVSSGSLAPIDTQLFDNPFSIGQRHWKPGTTKYRFLYNQRGHQRLSLIEIDATTSATRVVAENRSDTFVDYAHKTYLQFLDESDQLIWMSEKDGWNHLYLIDQKSGKVIRPLTSGTWVVRGVDSFDPDSNSMLVTAGGFYPDQDPYQRHLLRLTLDGEITPLTRGDGDHRWTLSPTGQYFVDSYSRVDLAPVHELRRVHDGSLVCKLVAADWSPLLRQGWQPPERFVSKGRDGETDIHGIIIRPHDFDPQKRYPVLEAIYAGPHSAFVPKSFGLHRGYADLADLGFIVVKIDGMGTSHRSKAFHDVCWKNLVDSGFPDRKKWMRAAAKQRPEMDLDRIGIWGGSAGGQSALAALLHHHDFYKAAAADCGCHDNRMDKIWWNEAWMGWPVGPHYQEQSNVTNAHRLQGDLLLTVGELDRNVDPASTMQVVNALIAADKDFELIVFPGAGHGAGESTYGKRRRADFFLRKLWGKTLSREIDF